MLSDVMAAAKRKHACVRMFAVCWFANNVFVVEKSPLLKYILRFEIHRMHVKNTFSWSPEGETFVFEFVR